MEGSCRLLAFGDTISKTASHRAHSLDCSGLALAEMVEKADLEGR
jgi:hypothetical protein